MFFVFLKNLVNPVGVMLFPLVGRLVGSKAVEENKDKRTKNKVRLSHTFKTLDFNEGS